MGKTTFNNLKIDTWYKVLIYFGGIITFTGIFFETKLFDNKNVVLFGLGFFLFGIGTWKIHSIPRGGVITAGTTVSFINQLREKISHLSFLGIILSILGLALIIFSTSEIVKYYFT